MLTFDLNNPPPTAEQIEQEREHLQAAMKKFKTRVLTLSVTAILIASGCLAFFWSEGVLTGENVFTVACSALIVGAGTSILTGAVFHAVAGSFIGAVASAFVGAFIGAGPYFGFVIFTVSGSLAGAGIGTGAGSRMDPYNKLLSGLTPLPEAYKDRCPKILEYCRQDEQCESYRLAVAQLDRPLLVAEADMIEERVKTADSRQAAEEKARKTEEACRLLLSKEPVK